MPDRYLFLNHELILEADKKTSCWNEHVILTLISGSRSSGSALGLIKQRLLYIIISNEMQTNVRR